MFYAWRVLTHFFHIYAMKNIRYKRRKIVPQYSRRRDTKMATRRTPELRIRITASVQQTTSFRRNFMRASRAPPLTNDTPWFSVCPGGCDDVSFRRRLFPHSHSLSPALPSSTHNNCFSSLSSAVVGSTLFVRARAVFARLTFQIPWNHRSLVPSLRIKIATGYRIPEAPTEMSSGPRNGPPCTLEHPSFVFQAGVKSDRGLIDIFVSTPGITGDFPRSGIVTWNQR